MTVHRDFKSKYLHDLEPLAKRLTEKQLETMRTSAIGGVSAAAAILLLLSQTGAGGAALEIALYGAAIAIPAWVVAWQYVETYLFYGEALPGHFRRPDVSGIGFIAAFLGMASLFVSTTAIFFHLSSNAALIFVAGVFIVTVLILRLIFGVRREVEQLEGRSTAPAAEASESGAARALRSGGRRHGRYQPKLHRRPTVR